MVVGVVKRSCAPAQYISSLGPLTFASVRLPLNPSTEVSHA
jgi:hypothetical protein